MSRALLDVNVLLALLDSEHVEHQVARRWITSEIQHGWASCAITQNGFVRIVSQPRYPKPLAPCAAIEVLAKATNTDHHVFWPCDVSVLDSSAVDRTRLHGSKQVTDLYLLALAVAKGGRLVTYDRAIPISAVPGARSANLVVL